MCTGAANRWSKASSFGAPSLHSPRRAEAAQAVVICPSNPWVSIGPILAIEGIQEILKTRFTLAVSPIIGGAAVKGPAAKMYSELGITPSALAVAEQYRGLIAGFVMDEVDSELHAAVARYKMCVLVTRTLMKTAGDRKRLAEDVIDFIGANLT